MIAQRVNFGDRLCTPRMSEGMFEEVPEAALERVTHTPSVPFSNQTTSKAAAVEIESRTYVIRLKIWLHLIEAGPLTDEAIAHDLQLGGNTERPRRGALVTEGCVIDSGERVKLQSGKSGIAWKATAKRPDPLYKEVKPAKRQQERPNDAA